MPSYGVFLRDRAGRRCLLQILSVLYKGSPLLGKPNLKESFAASEVLVLLFLWRLFAAESKRKLKCLLQWPRIQQRLSRRYSLIETSSHSLIPDRAGIPLLSLRRSDIQAVQLARDVAQASPSRNLTGGARFSCGCG